MTAREREQRDMLIGRLRGVALVVDSAADIDRVEIAKLLTEAAEAIPAAERAGMERCARMAEARAEEVRQQIDEDPLAVREVHPTADGSLRKIAAAIRSAAKGEPA